MDMTSEQSKRLQKSARKIDMNDDYSFDDFIADHTQLVAHESFATMLLAVIPDLTRVINITIKGKYIVKIRASEGFKIESWDDLPNFAIRYSGIEASLSFIAQKCAAYIPVYRPGDKLIINPDEQRYVIEFIQALESGKLKTLGSLNRINRKMLYTMFANYMTGIKREPQESKAFITEFDSIAASFGITINNNKYDISNIIPKEEEDRYTYKYTYVYLIHPAEYKNDNVYKIGKTRVSGTKRFEAYAPGSDLLLHIWCNDCDKIEKEIITVFNKKYGPPCRGSEYFRGNAIDMIDDIYHLVRDINDAYKKSIKPISCGLFNEFANLYFMPASKCNESDVMRYYDFVDNYHQFCIDNNVIPLGKEKFIGQMIISGRKACGLGDGLIFKSCRRNSLWHLTIHPEMADMDNE
jgi:hypothetical protein